MGLKSAEVCSASLGKANSASLAASFQTSFDGIELGILVGISNLILVGNTLTIREKSSLQESLGKPDREVRVLLAKMSGSRAQIMLRDKTSSYLTAMCMDDESYSYPGAKYDR